MFFKHVTCDLNAVLNIQNFSERFYFDFLLNFLQTTNGLRNLILIILIKKYCCPGCRPRQHRNNKSEDAKKAQPLPRHAARWDCLRMWYKFALVHSIIILLPAHEAQALLRQ